MDLPIPFMQLEIQLRSVFFGSIDKLHSVIFRVYNIIIDITASTTYNFMQMYINK